MKIPFNQHLWQGILSKLVILCKSYVQRVLLGRDHCVCALLVRDNKESVQCDVRQIWFHCVCVAKKLTAEDAFICAICSDIAEEL